MLLVASDTINGGGGRDSDRKNIGCRLYFALSIGIIELKVLNFLIYKILTEANNMRVGRWV
jgi:hypothetical protein